MGSEYSMRVCGGCGRVGDVEVRGGLDKGQVCVILQYSMNAWGFVGVECGRQVECGGGGTK